MILGNCTLQAQQALMKVEWPAGLAAAGLLANPGSGSKKSFFSGMKRPAWLLRKLSNEVLAGGAAGGEGSPTAHLAGLLGRTLSGSNNPWSRVSVRRWAALLACERLAMSGDSR